MQIQKKYNKIISMQNSQKSKLPSYYESQIDNFKVSFALDGSIFYIKLTQEQSLSIYSAELTHKLLNELQPSIMITFGTIDCMYQEMVEIAKTKEDIHITQNGVIKVRINISLKSGVKHKDLVLETQRRSMNDNDLLEMKIRKQRDYFKSEKEQLLQKIHHLEKELDKAQKQRGKLVEMVEDQKKIHQSDVERLNKQLTLQRQHNAELFQEMKEEIRKLRNQLNGVKSQMGLLLNRSTRLKLKVNRYSKCQQVQHGENCYKVAQKVLEKRGSGWAQVLFEQACSLNHPSFYDLNVLNTKNHYICLGFGKKTCLDELDSKWKADAVSLFLLDTTILSEGKNVREPDSGIRVTKNDKIRVMLYPIEKKVIWYLNSEELGSVNISEEFLTGEIYPLLVCNDEGDRIQLM